MHRPELKIIFLADTHLGFDYPLRPRVQMRRRGYDFFENFQRVLDYAERTRPDIVVHGGDLFFRSRVPQKIVDLAYEKLNRFAGSGIPFFIVPGNHERSRLPASLLLTDGNIHVFDKPRTFEFAAQGITVSLSGFPFIREDVAAHFKSVLDETGWAETDADIKLLCMHQVVEGSQVGPSNYTFRAGPDVLKLSVIPPEFTATLSGHIHRRQILGAGGRSRYNPIIYAGSIERTSFAEQDENKGFYEIVFRPDEAGIWNAAEINFIELPARPMIDIELNPTMGCEEIVSHLRRVSSSIPKDSIIRLGSDGALSESVRSMLTASFLRSILPPSVNYQLRASMYMANQEEPADAL